MKVKEIILGVKHRIEMLEKELEVLRTNRTGVERVVDEDEGRLDELQSLLNWIEE